MSEIIVRKARREDCPVIRKLIQEVAELENNPDAPKIDYKTLERDGFDGHPLYLCNVATFKEKIIGYSFGFYTYSTWIGKAMYLEDIYVTSEFRTKYVSMKLLKRAAKDAVEKGCHRLDFVVLQWNLALEFYKMYGAYQQHATDLTTKEKWRCYHFNEEDMKKLASE